MSAIGVTPFKRHALYAWVPDSRHVSLSRCDGVYLLTYLRPRAAPRESATHCTTRAFSTTTLSAKSEWLKVSVVSAWPHLWCRLSVRRVFTDGFVCVHT